MPMSEKYKFFPEAAEPRISAAAAVAAAAATASSGGRGGRRRNYLNIRTDRQFCSGKLYIDSVKIASQLAVRHQFTRCKLEVIPKLATFQMKRQQMTVRHYLHETI